jgi:ParB/RepB/Spo0J family partition protein
MRLKPQESVLAIPLDLIDESATNPREHYSERKLQELAETIQSVGVVQPVIVRRHRTAAGRFDLVFGSRRLRGSRLAGNNTVPGIVRELTDEQILLIQFIENEHREDLSPLSQARGYAGLMAKNPALYTVEELTARLGKSDGRYVAERLQLLKLIGPAQALLDAERLPFRHAFELSRLTDEQQERGLHVCFSNYENAEGVLQRQHQTVSISVEGLRQWISTHFHLDLNNAPFPLDQPLAGEIACVDCPKRAGTAPLLFGDIATEDTCLDPECFTRKKAALIQISVEKLENQGLQVVRISNNLRVGAPGEKADALYRGEYRNVERDSCAYTEIGVYDDGSNLDRQIYVCREPSCPVHEGKSRYTGTEEKQVRKKKLRDQREEKQFRADLLAGVKERISKTPVKTDLYIVACRLLSLMPHDNRVAVFRLFKWLEQKSAGKRGGKHVDYCELGKVQLAKLGVFELHRFLIVASLTPDLAIPESQPEQSLPSNSLLAVTARRLGLDLRTVRAQARKTLQSQRKAS